MGIWDNICWDVDISRICVMGRTKCVGAGDKEKQGIGGEGGSAGEMEEEGGHGIRKIGGRRCKGCRGVEAGRDVIKREISMTETLHAIFDGRVLRPKGRVNLEINRDYVLTVELKEAAEGIEKCGQDSAFNLSALAVKTGISDLASEHDHYLYGNLKRGNDNA